MRTFFIMAAAAAALTSTIGMARPTDATEQRFTHADETYVYQRRPGANGSELLVGRRLSDGQRFRLRIARGQVRGTAGGVPVAFRVADARGAARRQVASVN